MKRIVYPQRGSGSARATISARQVTVKYKPSEGFLLQLKSRRNLSFQDKNHELEEADIRATSSHEAPTVSQISDEPVPPSKGGLNRPQLPRLRAFLDGVEVPRGAALPPLQEKVERSEGSGRATRSQNQSHVRAGRSAYEELQARWRRR